MRTKKRLTRGKRALPGRHRTTMLAGPALGGVLIGFMGATSVLADRRGHLRRRRRPRRRRSSRAGRRCRKTRRTAASAPAVRFVAAIPASRAVAGVRTRRRGLDGVLHLRAGARADPLRPPSVDRGLADRIVRSGRAGRERRRVPLPGSPPGWAHDHRHVRDVPGPAALAAWFDLPAAGYSVAILLSGIAERVGESEPAHHLDRADPAEAAGERADHDDGRLGSRQSARAVPGRARSWTCSGRNR